MIKVNLLPPRIKAERAKRMMIIAAVTAGAVILTIPAGVAYLKWLKSSSLTAEIKKIDAEAASYADTIAKVEALEKREVAVAKKLDVLNKLLARQSTWIRVLESLSTAQAQARDLWLESISTKLLQAAPDTGKTEMVVMGFAYSVGSIDEFVRAFVKSEFAPEVSRQRMDFVLKEGGERVVQFNYTFKFKTT